jgi:trehalose 6-phosphate phosphatase
VTDERVKEIARRGRRAGLFLDFDGTLSEVVPVASEARPVEGVVDLLAGLAGRLGVVAVVSGRSARELVRWLGDGPEIWGVHGAQRARGGVVELSEAVRPFAALMEDVRRRAEDAAASLEGVDVEDKEVVVTLHWRAAADREAARRSAEAVAGRLAETHGVTLAPGRMTLELRPPVELSKAAVVLGRARAEGLDAVAFVGDDTVDLPAFDALDELAAHGVLTLRVAVRSDESPPELLARADLVVDGPQGVVELLRGLAG